MSEKNSEETDKLTDSLKSLFLDLLNDENLPKIYQIKQQKRRDRLLNISKRLEKTLGKGHPKVIRLKKSGL